jgi:hypothetical protein
MSEGTWGGLRIIMSSSVIMGECEGEGSFGVASKHANRRSQARNPMMMDDVITIWFNGFCMQHQVI